MRAQLLAINTIGFIELKWKDGSIKPTDLMRSLEADNGIVRIIWAHDPPNAKPTTFEGVLGFKVRP